MKTETTMIELTINGKIVAAQSGDTILAVAKRAGVRIPTLCHDHRLKPIGACRLCLVEVEGNNEPVPACVTITESGMEVRTDSENIRELRRGIIDLLLSDQIGRAHV